MSKDIFVRSKGFLGCLLLFPVIFLAPVLIYYGLAQYDETVWHVIAVTSVSTAFIIILICKLFTPNNEAEFIWNLSARAFLLVFFICSFTSLPEALLQDYHIMVADYRWTLAVTYCWLYIYRRIYLISP